MVEQLSEPPEMCGDQDARWYREHIGSLDSYRGRWIAVAGGVIVLSSESLQDLHDALTSRKIRNAYVVRHPEEAKQRHLIAWMS